MIDLTAPLLGLETALTFQAQIDRDQAVKDGYGAKTDADWQPLATVACFLWWGTGATITRAGSVQQRPEATVDLDIGGMIMPAGTDVTARDRISHVLDNTGREIAEHLLILAVAPFAQITEVSIRRVS